MRTALAALASTCEAASLPFDPAWRPRLEALHALLADFNAKTNLVGDAGPAALCGHLVEAWAVAAAAHAALGREPKAIADIGAGAGLEALALALAFPAARIVAVEPRAKRAIFIELAADALALRNLTVRTATVHAAALGAEFDLATARAVWPPAEWLGRAAALLTRGGVAAVHGRGPAPAFGQELAAAVPGWRVAATRDVPGGAHAVAVLARA